MKKIWTIVDSSVESSYFSDGERTRNSRTNRKFVATNSASKSAIEQLWVCANC